MPSKRLVLLPFARCIALGAVLGRWGLLLRTGGEAGGEVGGGGGGISPEEVVAEFPCMVAVSILARPGSLQLAC